MSETIPIEVADTATVAPDQNGAHAAGPASRPARPAPPTAAPQPPRPGRPWKRLIFLGLLLIGAAGYVAVHGLQKAKADAAQLVQAVRNKVAGAPKPTLPEPGPAPSSAERWDGLVTLGKAAREGMGFRIVPVEGQDKPTTVELTGTTDYDQNTLAKVRPLFDARVAQVFKSTGQTVKKGDALVELYSTTLAAAKIDFRSKYAKYIHDTKMVESRKPLVDNHTITEVNYLDTYLAAMTSKADYIGAKDKLQTYGIPVEEIDRLAQNIEKDPSHKEVKDADKGGAAQEDVHDISRLILRSPIDGMIVERDVVAGNFYDDMAVLMVISPMDKLWVWGDVYEKDQSDVHLGQTWEISFPNMNIKVAGKIEQIATRFDANTRTLKIRATIPNPNKQLKADQRVRASLEIPAQPGQTVIPRNSVVVVSGENSCFVQTPENPDKFRRKLVEIDQENHDFVVVRKGLDAGEKIVSNGSLILAQLYEDLSTVSTGLPAQ